MREDNRPLYQVAKMTEEQSAGAAIMIGFLGRLFNASPKPLFGTVEIVQLLRLIGERELPAGTLKRVEELAELLNGEGRHRCRKYTGRDPIE